MMGSMVDSMGGSMMGNIHNKDTYYLLLSKYICKLLEYNQGYKTLKNNLPNNIIFSS